MELERKQSEGGEGEKKGEQGLDKLLISQESGVSNVSQSTVGAARRRPPTAPGRRCVPLGAPPPPAPGPGPPRYLALASLRSRRSARTAR